MEVVAGKAVIRKRTTDKAVRNAYIVAVLCLLFAMVFVIVVTRSTEGKSSIAILDNSGAVHRAEIIPFPEARDSTPEAMRKADLLWRELIPVWKQKKVLQYPRINGYIVDVISDNEMHLKVSLQLVRQAFALDGSEFPGVEDRNVILYFKRNENFTDNFYKPWELVDFLEVPVKKES